MSETGYFFILGAISNSSQPLVDFQCRDWFMLKGDAICHYKITGDRPKRGVSYGNIYPYFVLTLLLINATNPYLCQTGYNSAFLSILGLERLIWCLFIWACW